MSKDNIFGTWVDDAEKEMFVNAANKTILDQSKKITELEKEIENLKIALSTTTPAIQLSNEGDSKDDEIIAKCELAKLRNDSSVRPLTMEECRKVEIYAKVLLNKKNIKKDKEEDTKAKTTGELLSLVDNNEANARHD